MAQPTEPKRTSGGNWRQFWLLLWKNWLLQRKRVVRTVVIVLLPILFCIILVLSRNNVEHKLVREQRYHPFLVETDLKEVLEDPPEKLIFAYAPNTTLVTRIVNRAAALMNFAISTDFGFTSETAIEEYLTMGGDIFGAIVFNKNDWVNIPKNVSYKIRLRSDKTDSKSGEVGKVDWKTDATFYPEEMRNSKQPEYKDEGFLAIQKAVDLSLIAEVNRSFDPTTTNVTTQLKQFPYPPYKEDGLIVIFKYILPVLILVSFILVAPTICQEVVLEKENKFKESMKLMGMRMWLYWLSWFVKYLLLTLTSIILMTVILHASIASKGPVLFRSSGSVTFVFLILYSTSIITFCLAISTLVKKATHGSAIGVILYILLYTPYFYLMTIYDKMAPWQKFLASLDFNLAMGMGFSEISHYEELDIGVQWSNIWSSEDDFTMGHILLMLLLDTIIYSLFTWYLDAVIPGEFGTPQPFDFPFLKEYWMGREGAKINLSNEDFMTLVPEDKRPYFETPLQDAKAGIQIRGLTKNFGSKRNPAVNNLNIDIYEGNITALLGHNGAGKTTTMFVLTGFLPPSKGTAFINGFDITRNMDIIRRDLGLCPQHNILFDTLTVKEHLLFFAVLKGCSFKLASLEMYEMVKVLHMEDKLNALTKTLSGGQKRKLSVGIALIAGSKLVILDEPTSGMDPEARRQTWDILQSQRKDRTIILSTHYMDEADILGDRIAIMYNGEIECYGTPMFLKKKYGVGYHLTIVKTPTCDVKNLLAAVKSEIPLTQLVSDEAKEVMFLLPSNQSSKFEGLFETLETDRITLGIETFGVSVTTMEDVFLRVKDSSTPDDVPRTSIATDAEIEGKTARTKMLNRKEIGWKSQDLQLRAMFYKRFIHSVRNYELTLCQMLIPAIFAIFACLILLKKSENDYYPALTLDLTRFENPITPYDVRPPQSANALNLAACYKTSVSRQSKPIFINSGSGDVTMDEYVISIGKDSLDKYNKNYQIAAIIEGDPDGGLNITGLFNSHACHAIAISLSYLGNTLMQCFGNKEYQIETINHPLPRNILKKVKDTSSNDPAIGFFVAFCVSFGLAMLFSTFVVFLIKERKIGAKHCQLVSGVRLHNFWLATFLWDYVNYLIPCILIIVIILAFQSDGFWQNSWIILIALMLYGFSMLPFTYVMSFLFEEGSVGSVWVSVICIITGIFGSIVILILEALKARSASPTVRWILYIFLPPHCFNEILQNIFHNYIKHKSCRQMTANVKLVDLCAHMQQIGQTNPCCPDNCGEFCHIADNYLSWTPPGIGRPLFALVLQGIVFFLILYIIESGIVGRQLNVIAPNRVSQAMLTGMDASLYGRIIEDSDVANERQRIHSNPIQELVKTNPVVTQDLTKLYGYFVAVNQLSIGVSEKECFGLLGVNGAGKTTTFRMLTGEIRPSFGNAYVAGISVQDDISKVRQKIGYCAQFDSIIDQMTVHETLWMYACAHGIPDQVRQDVIDRLIEQMTLKPYTNKRAGILSGGNKRKLCVAVALMGNPTVVFLDEPTTGVDPEARRHVWNTLADARKAGTTIILTSHSMEECEAICTRMGILVSGRFLCLGSLQHLRDKFSDGYTLTIKLKRSPDTEKPEQQQERIEKLKTFISDKFPNSVLKDHHENLLNYEVKTRVIKWSEMFGVMERAKVTYEIEDYSVGQTTLEQLFIAFARMQRGGPQAIYV